MVNPKISIITVSFNAEKTIEDTIKSVISQSYKNIEYIIIDGKSTDNTLKIINKYKKMIAKIVSETDNGLYDAMNKGVRKATGEVVYFLNADDTLQNNEIVEIVADEFEKGDYDLVFGDIYFYYPNEKKQVKISRNFSLGDLKNGVMPPHQGSFVKRKWLVKYPFETKYKSSADFDFFCRFIKENPKIKKINKVVAKMQMGGVSSGKISHQETQKIVCEHFGTFYCFKLKVKHIVFGVVKKLFLVLKINFHKG